MKHHSGRIAVHPDVNVVIAPAGVELKCGCGTTRYILNRPANELWNGDPLTDEQSKPFADRLSGVGVVVTTLFYPEDHQPQLPHEYQFNLDTADGQTALQSMLAFLRDQTAS
ncbi:hypothetical protein BH20CHL3_BH20CHL3_02290 [soil metagenome]